jgi:hypothetical protein
MHAGTQHCGGNNGLQKMPTAQPRSQDEGERE